MTRAVDVNLATSAVKYILGIGEVAGIDMGPLRFGMAAVAAHVWATRGPSFATRALLFADLNYPAGATAFVYGDTDALLRGVYLKAGASGAGSWSRIGPLPEADLSAIEAEIDAIWTALNLGFTALDAWETATAYQPHQALTDSNKLYVVLAAHTSGVLATDLAAGRLRLIADYNAITAAAQAFRNEAQSAADAAIAATGIGIVPTKAAGEATTFPAATKTVVLKRWTVGSPIAPAEYGRIIGEPLHTGKFRSVDRFLPDGSTDAISGGWWEIAETIITPQMLGAMADYVWGTWTGTDDSAAINNTLAIGRTVYIPRGDYGIANQINMPKVGQTVFGAGRWESRFFIDRPFTGANVINMTGFGNILRGIGIFHEQPDTSLRGNLYAQPRSILVAATAQRSRLEGIYIERCMDGIHLTGNAGGVTLDDIELSGFGTILSIDGPTDSVRCRDLHAWPHGLTVNQASIMYDGGATVSIGRADDFKFSSCLFYGPSVNVSNLGSGFGFGTFVDCDFDAYGQLNVSAGRVLLTNCYFTLDAAGRLAITTSLPGGHVTCNNVHILCNVLLTGNNTIISHGAGALAINGGVIEDSAANRAIVAFNTADSLAVRGMKITGGGHANAIVVNCDSIVTGCNFGNYSTPISRVAGELITADNELNGGSDFALPFIAGAVRRRYLSGTTDGAGFVAIAHGITNAHQRVLRCDAHVRGSSGEMQPIGSYSVDGTNLNLTPGGSYPTRLVRAVLEYTETSQSGW